MLSIVAKRNRLLRWAIWNTQYCLPQQHSALYYSWCNTISIQAYSGCTQRLMRAQWHDLWTVSVNVRLHWESKSIRDAIRTTVRSNYRSQLSRTTPMFTEYSFTSAPREAPLAITRANNKPAVRTKITAYLFSRDVKRSACLRSQWQIVFNFNSVCLSVRLISCQSMIHITLPWR